MSDLTPTNKYDSMNGVQLRNALSEESDVNILRIYALDRRRIVSEKAATRLRTLGAELNPKKSPIRVDRSDMPPVAPAEPDDGLTEIGRAAQTPAPELPIPEVVRRPSRVIAPEATLPEPTRPTHRPAGKVKTERRRTAEPKPVAMLPTPKPPAGLPSDKTCPSCGETKPLLADFGLRWVPGPRGTRRQIPQPWCRMCRNESSKRARVPRESPRSKKK